MNYQDLCSTDVENRILAAMLAKKKCIVDVQDKVDITDFYKTSSQVVYETLVEMFTEGCEINLTSLIDKLKRKEELNNVGGIYYIAKLPQIVSEFDAGITLEQDIKTLLDYSLRRRKVRFADAVKYSAFNFEEDAAAQTEKEISDLSKIYQGKDNSAGANLKDMLVTSVDNYLTPSHSKGFKTGFYDLDRLIPKGLLPTNTVVVAAGTGVGKSAFAMSLARHLMHDGANILYFSYEMSNEELIDRLLAAESGIPQKADGEYTPEESRAVFAGADRLHNYPGSIKIFDNVKPSVENIITVSRGAKLIGPVDVIIIDHIHLLHAKGYGANRVSELEYITSTLKNLAAEMRCIVVELSQLSRAMDTRQDKTPVLSDLRSSGSIAQDANIVLAISRDMEEQGAATTAELLVLKNRSGRVGKIDLLYMNNLTAFVSAARRVDAGKTMSDKNMPY